MFDVAYAQSPSTKPSIASLFTSRFPSQHRVIGNQQKLPASHTTLAEVLKKQGYATAGFIENPVAREEFGYAQGFEQWGYLQGEAGGWVSGDPCLAPRRFA